ncbi:MAG: ATP synthase F0 subunit B [Deltaproteobacteria bacterium]|jgi:F-type H+-transporting ATPase subunit b|nr:ATP synthase F0 subunit B [Deltaproteobacteria bacterium]
MITINVFDISLLVQIGAMLLLMVLLNSMLYKPMRQMLKDREDKLASMRKEVEKYEGNAAQLLTQFNQKLADARRMGQQQKESLKAEARAEEKGLMSAAAKESDAKKQQLLSELAADIAGVKQSLDAQCEVFAREVAQKLLGRAV